jgi:TetR/AcrR family transcriptional repressor of nem operon
VDQKTDTIHTSQQILDIAQRLVQTRGFNAFSYADIANELSVSKASLHYHFASKAKLGVRLIERYEDGIERALGEIDLAGGGAAAKLRRYGSTQRSWPTNACACVACSLRSLKLCRKPCKQHWMVFLP